MVESEITMGSALHHQTYGKRFLSTDNQGYKEFVIILLTKLEPRYEHKRTIVIDELENVDEIFFLSKGTLLLGYEVNKQKKYCMQMKDKGICGAYEVTFGKKAEFVYTALTYIEGFFIRLSNWHQILQ
jgi:hypothetical protein